MTAEILIEHVNQSITKALRHESWIDVDILHLGGFSTGEMRRLFSNLVHLPKSDPCYLECGLWKGATFCAAMNNSPTLNCYGVENFSQPFNDANVQQELEANVEHFKGGARSVMVINEDCFKVDLKKIKHPVDVFFFDSEHSYESQRDALPYYLESMADVFVFVVDDFSWSPVSTGTQEGLKMVSDKIKIERQWVLRGENEADDKVWHNGVAIYVISKIK